MLGALRNLSKQKTVKKTTKESKQELRKKLSQELLSFPLQLGQGQQATAGNGQSSVKCLYICTCRSNSLVYSCVYVIFAARLLMRENFSHFLLPFFFPPLPHLHMQTANCHL